MENPDFTFAGMQVLPRTEIGATVSRISNVMRGISTLPKKLRILIENKRQVF